MRLIGVTPVHAFNVVSLILMVDANRTRKTQRGVRDHMVFSEIETPSIMKKPLIRVHARVTLRLMVLTLKP